MPLSGHYEKSRSSRRKSLEDGGGRGRESAGLPVKSLAFGLLVIVIICGCQFMLITRNVESVQDTSRDGNEAVWHWLGVHESNLTALSMQYHDLVRLTAQLAEDVRKQHEELDQVMAAQGKGLAAVSGGSSAAQLQQLGQTIKREADLQATVSELQNLHQAGTAPQPPHAIPQHLRVAPQPLRAVPGPAGPPPAAWSPSNAGRMEPPSLPDRPKRKTGELPAEWLQRFSKEELQASAKEAEPWLTATREAFLHAWKGYKARAWGKDEMKPVSGQPGRVWANVGLQILDALSTIWVMGLTEQFDEATKFVEHSLTFDYQGQASFFEITIRALGGLCSAHSLSGRDIFLKRAVELADKMLPAFSRTEPFFPTTQVNLRTGVGKPGWFSGTVLSEAGTVQLEFRYVSQMTGDDKYQQKADTAMRKILEAAKGKGLVPWGLNRNGPPRFTNSHITFGAMGDSYYEYLLKMYLQTGNTEPEWKDAWKRAMTEMHQRLIQRTRTGLTYVAEEVNGQVKHKMDHLVCFVGGMLIHGSRQLHPSDVDQAWERTAAEITETCYQMYHRQPSHLAPECVSFQPQSTDHNRDMQVWNNAAHYLLRPETAEAIFYMFYYTGDPKYRRMAHEILEAIETHTKTEFGYSAVRDVRQPHPAMRNEMETFFMAETLKYLYLTFLPNPRDVVDLDEFVFTTEAHPLRIVRPGDGKRGGNLRSGGR